MSDPRPLTRRAKTVLLAMFMVCSLIWPYIVPGQYLVSYTYLCGGVVLAGLGFQAGVDFQKYRTGQEPKP